MAPSEEREEELMYSYCVRYMSADYVNFCTLALLFALLGAQTKESSLSCFAPTPPARYITALL